jgi:ParB-like chromosome segregation protein Spo0J
MSVFLVSVFFEEVLMKECNEVVRIGLDLLEEHPANANVMGRGNFAKLVGAIERSGRYEPIVVRRVGSDKYQIINGHHRVRALRELDYVEADCVVWDVDDDEAFLLLASLNRLVGRDDPVKKLALVRELVGRYEVKDLARRLPTGAKSIERMLSAGREKIAKDDGEVFLHAEVFMLTAEQKEVVEAGIARAVERLGLKGGRASKRAAAIEYVFGKFLN